MPKHGIQPNRLSEQVRAWHEGYVGLPIRSENADLCSKCQHDIYNYIFKHKESEDSNAKEKKLIVAVAGLRIQAIARSAVGFLVKIKKTR